ncbi:MAG TPA: glycosyltransferase family 9 protein [Candidatus Saccharimonadales bacterium]|nr:glycosyltransferase family 9 protein [Candidatus Saccharimonadales bacterium]
MSRADKPKLLVVELWGVGDLAIATPFLRTASERFAVTILAKPFALELQPRLWPEVQVVPFIVPWTAFRRKYRLWRWPWKRLLALRRQLREERFEFGLSARWDPRDHLLLKLSDAKTRLGFPRRGSSVFLTQPLEKPEPTAHRYEQWRIVGKALGIELPPRETVFQPSARNGKFILLHSGAGQPNRVWPLERYHNLAARLKKNGFEVRILCDSDQQDWWARNSEMEVMAPRTISELMKIVDSAAVFIGNDSGPGHLAAINGVPTFTIFGPQLPEWFAPLHPQAEWVEGKACPYKPCRDYCRFSVPHCLWNVSEEEVWPRVQAFVRYHVRSEPEPGADMDPKQV